MFFFVLYVENPHDYYSTIDWEYCKDIDIVLGFMIHVHIFIIIITFSTYLFLEIDFRCCSLFIHSSNIHFVKICILFGIISEGSVTVIQRSSSPNSFFNIKINRVFPLLSKVTLVFFISSHFFSCFKMLLNVDIF